MESRALLAWICERFQVVFWRSAATCRLGPPGPASLAASAGGAMAAIPPLQPETQRSAISVASTRERNGSQIFMRRNLAGRIPVRADNGRPATSLQVGWPRDHE